MFAHFCLGFILLLIIFTSVICFNLDGQPEKTTPSSHFNSHHKVQQILYHDNDEHTKHVDELNKKIHPDFVKNKLDETSKTELNEENYDQNFHFDLKSSTFRTATFPVNGGLQQDFEDFINLIPVDEVKNISIEFYSNDRQIRNIIHFFESNEFVQIRNRIFGIKELQSLANYLISIGVNFVELSKFIRQKIRAVHFNLLDGKKYHEIGSMGGIDGYLEQIQNTIPKDEIYIMFFEKVESSLEFSEFIEDFGNNESKRHFDELKNSIQLQHELRRLENHGISIKKLIDYGYGNFNSK